MNVLFITVDQLRADVLSCAGHPLVKTPNLDRLAANGVRFAQHYSQASPCAPGRACLYTGTYQLNNRVVGNGTPLDDRFDNVARAARRAGYSPALFGYTDVGIDPRTVADGDPRLSSYEGLLPGIDEVLGLREDMRPWLDWLVDLGHDPESVKHIGRALNNESTRPAEHGITTYLVDHTIEWIRRQESPWFAHLSLLRPHPPYSAAGHWSTAYDPADVDLPIAPSEDRHPLHEFALQIPASAAPTDEAGLRHMKAQYFGMVSDADAGLGRVFDALVEMGAWDDTFIVLTADHAEMLGDHGLKEKLGYWGTSYHIPAIVRDPRQTAAHGSVVNRFTENVDLFPTVCQAMGLDVPAQCDGVPLTPFLRGEEPRWWRTAAHWEFDWRAMLSDMVAQSDGAWPWDRRLDRMNLATIRTNDAAYVQFGDGSWLGFDLAADPTWRTRLTDDSKLLALTQQMLTWRQEHADRTLTNFLLENGGIGRRPVTAT